MAELASDRSETLRAPRRCRRIRLIGGHGPARAARWAAHGGHDGPDRAGGRGSGSAYAGHAPPEAAS